jgi:type IV pilus assembly protein PilY1
MNYLPMLKTRKIWIALLALLMACLLVYKVVAQSSDPAPIDFDNSPLVTNKTPANVVLALSVEWPTSGGAYKDASYIDGKEYIGYFNSNRCYTYPGYGVTPRLTTAFNANADYFTPTGATSATYQCNVAGAASGFSGNYLNYATMSAPDILRLALTGGDRGIDTTSLTVLDRGTIWTGGTSAEFRRLVNGTVTARVTPFPAASVYAYNCRDEVIFTTDNTKTCVAPALGDATDLRPAVSVPSTGPGGTTTVTPTTGPLTQVGTQWVDTGTTSASPPADGSPVTPVTLYTTSFILTTVVPPIGAEGTPIVRTSSYVVSTITPTSTTAPPAAAESPAVIRGYVNLPAGQTSTTAPITAAESPAVIRGGTIIGTQTTAPPTAIEPTPIIRGWYATGLTTTTVPPTAAEATPVVRGYSVNTLTASKSFAHQGLGAPSITTGVAKNQWICRSTPNPPGVITLGPLTQAAAPSCPAGSTAYQYPSASFIYNYYTQSGPFYRAYAPYYNSYQAYYYSYTPFYRNYQLINQYYAYTSYAAYKVYRPLTVWQTYTSTAKAIVKPRVQVCDSTEGPTRNLVYGAGANDFYPFCTKYANGGTSLYKPEGQIQQKSDSVRLSVFSYLLDDKSRNGGVMRAPMKYTGPNKYDANGTLATNTEREWDLQTGIFVDRPITDSVSTGYTHTGVINYLNRFGKSGNYKTPDPVGELWYEALRYLQGLQPSDDATTGMAEVMKDGYPVYTTWVDPLTTACERKNYILGIGDTNTHYDRTLPGLTRAEQTTLFNEPTPLADKTYSTTPTIKGSTNALNAHDWTQIMDAFERNGAAAKAYTDSNGSARTTGGNTARNTTMATNLDTTKTGSGGHASFHWAGLSYWANTQAIRKDVDANNLSYDKVRVKTFMIDVDENNQGSVNAAIQSTTFYLAGKYGFFDDRTGDGNPFTIDPAPNSGSRWADPDGTPKGYVLASQPQKLVAGVKKFFDASGGGSGSFATVAVSSNAFSASSPDGKTYAPSFIAGEWSGTVRAQSLTLNTTTNSLTTGSTTWDAGSILTLASLAAGTVSLPQVTPANRNIVTYLSSGTPRGVSFTYAATNNAADLPATFSQVPYPTTSTAVVTDTLAEARINYLRGERSRELDFTFRPRASIMGDVVNSGPVYKGAPNSEITGDGYPSFYNTNASRTGTVYVGANDGMLHAFLASTGQELFAYIPGAVLKKLPNLTSKNYIHTAFVDALPVVDEAKIGSSWKTVLASGMGGGAQGIFALDVTDPTAFNTDKVMFEFTDKDDPYMGNVTGQPKIVKMRDANSSTLVYKYFLVVSSGYNNYKSDGTGTFVASPDQALFFLDLSKPTATAWSEGSNYFKVIFPAGNVTKTNGLAQPGIRYGSAGEAIEFFAGDLQGNVWKAAFEKGINAAAVLDDAADQFPIYKNSGGTKKPLFTALDASSNPQPITSSPVIYPYLYGGNMVVFGTGRLMESTDRNSTATQSIYGIWDSGQTNAGSYGLLRNKLEVLTMNTTTLVVSGNTPTFADTTGSKRGWYFNLTRSQERVVLDAVAATGVVSINSSIPPSSICANNGDGLKYFLLPSSGKNAIPAEGEGGGYIGRSVVVEIDTGEYSERNVSGRRTATKREAILTQRQNSDGGNTTTTKNIDVTYLATGRIYWREVRDFNRTNP